MRRRRNFSTIDPHSAHNTNQGMLPTCGPKVLLPRNTGERYRARRQPKLAAEAASAATSKAQQYMKCR